MPEMEPSREEILAVYEQGPEAVIALVQNLVAAFTARIQVLEDRVHTLEARLRQDSHNSSKPPSSDPGHRRTDRRRRTRSLRPRSKRRHGGQFGHSGHTLSFAEQPDATELHRPGVCVRCHAPIPEEAPVIAQIRRQVWDLPPLHWQVTEHRALTCRCPACGEATTASFPPDVTAPIQYGPRVTALSLYLTAYQLLPLRRTAELLGDLLGQPVSQATLLAARDRAHSALAPVAEMIRAGLRAAPVLRCDESGCYVAGERWWTHVTSTEALTHYAADAKRGKAAMERIGILDHFAGVAVHDAYGSYLGFGCKHALCNAHHLRELLFLAEEEHEPWAAVMKRLLQEMYAFVERVRQQGADHLEPQDERRFLHRYGRVLAQGFAQHREPPARQAGRRGRFRQSKAKNLLDRLRDRRDEVLRFLMDFRVPFDNNLAERDLRMLKVQQKVSGCFRTKQGADQFARLRGYLSTATKQGVRAYEALQRLCLGAPFLPAVPT